ncbi:MAG: GTP-binding protein, partial [Prevotella sp.]|nr:GTP-binding protein [Prevotella sp.]
MQITAIPVLLLTGYLGSGKTTLLNRILTNKQGIRFSVIVNDIGEVNIDADLIDRGGIVGKKDESLVALQNGCICCTLKMDLVEQLRDITSMHRFDYIVIEASGICEPAPIAQTICSLPGMGIEYVKDGLPRLDCIVTVVDALRMKDEFGSGELLLRGDIEEEDIENLVIQQIEFCNIVLLNKASEITPEELGRVRKIVRTLQPKAEIIECDYGNVSLDKIINTHLFDFNSVASSAAWIHELDTVHDEHEHEDDDHDEHEHHEH